MVCVRRSIIAAFVALLPAGAAFSADVITVPTSTPSTLPVHEAAGFDWNGFYAGIYGTGRIGDISGLQYGAGVQAGVNAQFDFYLLGAEVAVQGLTGDTGSTTYGQILGRAGLVVTDDVLVYAASGYGLDLGAPDEDDVLLGGGIEAAVTDTISVEARYLHGFPVNGGNATDQITVGANFHF